MTQDTRTLDTLLGHRLTVFTNDHVGDKIASQGLYEKENLALLDTILANMAHAVVLDVGANIGNHALAFSTRARQVHAFEPLPRAHALLLENIRQNAIGNIQAHEYALSDSNGEDTLYMVTAGNLGASSFDKRRDDVEPVRVRKRVGDEVVDALGLERLDFVKIDVEAHEIFVLRGLRRSLETHRPYLMLEWNDPLSIERLSHSEELRFLFEQYEVFVLGSNYDRGYWKGRPLAFPRRKLTRLCKPRQAVLYPFNPARLYKNLLLVPRGKERYLPAEYLARGAAP